MAATTTLTPVAARPTVKYPPNVWEDAFLTYTPHDPVTIECKKQQIEELKEEVRKELKAATNENIRSPQLLKLIDSIQLLGVAYHFEMEVEEALKEMYEESATLAADEDLETSSLRFRLLRQEGYRVPPDVFNKFKDEEGKFKESLMGDLQGMLALYEASHLMVHGEDILEEALTFTTTHLQSFATDHPTNPLSEQVIRALRRPIRKAIIRVEARHYISFYQQHDDDSCNKSLLKLAKLDFNMLQSLHREELSQLSRWWKGLDFATKLPFARDRLVESYFWGLGVHFEPQYLIARRFLTKVTAVFAAGDDIYDAYGTVEELEALTEAIERWDASRIDELPADFLKCYYGALLDICEEMEEEMAKIGKSYRVPYIKELIKRLVRCYLVEVKWLKQGYTPTYEEYMSNALESTSYAVLIGTSLVGIGDVTEEVFQWVLGQPKMIRATEAICRLMDDLVSHEFEKIRVHIPTGIECYTKQYEVTEEEACDEMKKQIVNAWKDVNEGCLRPAHMPPMLVARLVLNFARVMDVLYKDADEYSRVGKLMKHHVALMLIHPVSI